jgi:hypothetical protein
MPRKEASTPTVCDADSQTILLRASLRSSKNKKTVIGETGWTLLMVLKLEARAKLKQPP